MPHQKEIYSRSNSQMKKLYIGIAIRPSSNNIPSSPPSGPGIKIKALHEQKPDDELPAGIGGDYSLYLLFIDGDLKIGDVSGGNFYMKNHTLSQ